MTKDAPVEVPEWLDSIPDDATEQEKLYLRAQLIIQSAFYTCGDLNVKPGTRTLGRHDLESAIAFSLAMLLTTDDELRTKWDLQIEGQRIGKYIGEMANAIRSANDTNPAALLATLNLSSSKPN